MVGLIPSSRSADHATSWCHVLLRQARFLLSQARLLLSQSRLGRYHLLGQPMRVAEQLEASCVLDGIHVSQQVRFRVSCPPTGVFFCRVHQRVRVCVPFWWPVSQQVQCLLLERHPRLQTGAHASFWKRFPRSHPLRVFLSLPLSLSPSFYLPRNHRDVTELDAKGF